MARENAPSRAEPAGIESTLVEVGTADFSFTVAVLADRAPISGGYFLRDVDEGLLDGSSIFRIVNLQNQPATVPAKIEVIQMGLREMNPAIPPALEHEPTGRTGLLHRQGVVSLARFAPGAVYHSFFVCMRDEPALDQGGGRNPDGMGFAAFGFIARGFEHLQRVFAAHAEASRPEYLDTPLILQHFRRS
jgi:peptidyl-prolyl cis-trans isomerase A (cyclophilin A)